MRSAPPFAAVVLATVVLLTGCVPQTPNVDPPTEPATEPVFATDEEALAAATGAYKAYLAMSDLIAQEGGKNPERIAPFVTEEWLPNELNGFSELQTARHYQTGTGSISASELQSYVSASIGAYYCMDLSDIRVLDDESHDVTPASRPSELTVEVQFLAGKDQQVLKIDGIEPWPGRGIC